MSPKQINSRLLSWAGDDLEPAAQEQAERVSRLPFVQGHVALMPDAHWGMGATVGSVIPTRGAIIPAAVGVDIGCVDADTEYLSPTGWVRIADYDGGMVMQWSEGWGSFVQPERYIKREQSSFLHFKTKYGVNQMLTPDHRMLVWRPRGRAAILEQQVVTAGEIASEHERLKMGSKVKIETSFLLDDAGSCLLLTDPELRVQVMVMADGHIDGDRCVLRFKKTRKIERAEKLLADAGIEHSTSYGSDGVTTYRFIPPRIDKSYGWCWEAALDQLRVIVDEVFEWDGYWDGRCFYTRDRASADFMQYAFAATGHRAVMREDKHHRDGEIDYRVFAHSITLIGIAGTPKSSVAEVPSSDGFAYCFTVPSGFLVLRRGGNVFITGNCGMIAAKLNLTSHDLPDDLKVLHAQIVRDVPAGVGQGHSWKRALPVRSPGAPQDEAIWTEKLTNKAMTQMGSLGSGNHFIEVCLDEMDDVWIVLHSGSRGVGNELAKAHIEGAKKLMKQYFIDLEDPDLAYLVEGTPEFASYIADMLWAQEYAMTNRQVMLDLVMEAVRRHVAADAQIIDKINCHHNFTQLEHHHGKNVWVTRKGAVQADVGRRGVIPGSMGTRSYIVTGTGNLASYNSCSHGAGRRMSRTEARKTLTIGGLETAMAGKTWNAKNAQDLLDESPAAYKDIDVVMARQHDLVTIEHELHQILNMKGV